MVQIDLTSRVVRQEKVLPYLKELMRKFNNDHEKVNEECRGMGIVTSYSKKGKHTYRVDAIEFEKSVNDTFEIERKDEKREVTFK
jgi:hypothetical protein